MTETSKTPIVNEHKVFVGNLSFKSTKESLATFAGTIGKVETATIIFRGRRSLGYGFVTFSSQEEAKKATEELNQKSLDGREVNVQIAHSREKKKKNNNKKKNKKKKNNNKKKSIGNRVTAPSKTTLFVANLPYATTEDDLKKLFANYKLMSTHISRMKSGRSKGYGFVEFENEQDQLKAFESVKDVNLEGRAVYLKIALSEPKPMTNQVESLKVNDTKQ